MTAAQLSGPIPVNVDLNAFALALSLSLSRVNFRNQIGDEVTNTLNKCARLPVATPNPLAALNLRRSAEEPIGS
jgi:hypothetical protein